MRENETNFLDAKKFIIFDPIRIENIIANSELATKVESKDDFIEVIFTNKGKLDGSEVYYNIPLTHLNSDQIYKLLSYKRKSKDERRWKNGNRSNRISQRSRPTRP